jgi:hypothetical protein
MSKELDKEAAEQQLILQRSGVPGIFSTTNLDEIHIQSQILELIMLSSTSLAHYNQMNQSSMTNNVIGRFQRTELNSLNSDNPFQDNIHRHIFNLLRYH